jgi:prepilin-type N-terminal cleavage/methylation domain-containing protein
MYSVIGRRKEWRQAFTLIELLVVIVVIAVLITVAAPSFLRQQDKAQDSAVQQYLAAAYKSAKADSAMDRGRYQTGATLVTAIGRSEPQLRDKITLLRNEQNLPAEGGHLGVCADTSERELRLAGRSRSGKGYVLIASNATGLMIKPGGCVSGPDDSDDPDDGHDGDTSGPPVSSSAPELSGSARVNETLSASRGSWTPAEVSFSYQWLRCDATTPTSCTDVGSDADSYRVSGDDIGSRIAVEVTATNAHGSAKARSEPTAVVAPAPGFIMTLAGTGNAGFQDGQASAAQFNRPRGVAVAPDGSVVVADTDNARIRRISPDGTTVTTIAGTGVGGSAGVPGTAVDAQVRNPLAVAVGDDGTVYIADNGNDAIRRISTDGIISNRSTWTKPFDVDAGSNDHVHGVNFDDTAWSTTRAGVQNYRVAGTGTPGYNGDSISAVTAMLNMPRSIAQTSDGSFIIADRGNNRVRIVTSDGIIRTLATVQTPEDVAVGPDDTIYVLANSNTTIHRVESGGTLTRIAGTGAGGYNGDGKPAVEAQILADSIDVGPDGSIYIADYFNHRIRKIQG